jgi:hypothetical protein
MLSHFADFFGSGVINPSSDFGLMFPSTPNMTVGVGLGTARVNGYRVYSDGTTTGAIAFTPADITYPRIDLIEVGPIPISSVNIANGINQNLGQIIVKAGTPATTPVCPSADAGMVPLYSVAIAANQTAIVVGNITSLRSRVTFFGYDIVAKFVNYDANMLAKTGGAMTAGTITLFQNPVNPLDAVTKQYVDQNALGLQPKTMAYVATTGSNITLSGLQTIDSVSVTAGMRVLVKDQTTQSANGIYVAASGAWSRSTDAATGLALVNAYVYISNGTINEGTTWIQQTANPITLGTSNIVFGEFSSAPANAIYANSSGTSAACTGNAATATYATTAGSAPANGGTSAACSGNSATATYANTAGSAPANGGTSAACSGNSATATYANSAGSAPANGGTSAACSGNSATANYANSAGSTGSCSGNAATASALLNSRTINGVSFNGTSNIANADYVVAQSLSVNGYTVWASGKIEQWGVTDTTHYNGITTRSYSFPVTFPNNCFSVTATAMNPTANVYFETIAQLVSWSTSSFSILNSPTGGHDDWCGCSWYAVGN